MSGSVDIRLTDANLSKPDSIVGIIKEWQDADTDNRVYRQKQWQENLNFFAGNQWIRWSDRDHRFESIPITDSNRAIERPVTNHVMRWVNANVSRFTSKPSVIIDPNSDDMQDKTSAQMCEIIKDYLWEEMGQDTQYLEAALWGTICGTVFRKSYKKYANKSIQTPNGESIPVRCVESDIINPFQITFDGMPQRWRDIGTVMHSQVRRIDDIKAQFSQQAPGYFPDAAQDIKEEAITASGMQMSEGLKSIVDGSGSYAPSAASTGELKDSAIYSEVYVKPSRKYQKGIMICSAGSKLLYFGDSPAYYQEGKIWHPLTSWTWGTMPGSVWGIALASHLTKLNRRVNAIDALMAYNRKTMAVPGWFAPNGCNIPEGSFVGTPGLVKGYDETPSGGKPFPHSGQALSDQVLAERAIIIQEGDRLSLAGDLRSGENPVGVTTLGQLQIIQEETEKTQSKTVASWEKFIQQSVELDLLNFKDCYQVPDPSMIKEFKKYSKDITEQAWQAFTGNYIRDNASIRVEEGSTIAKSRVMRQKMLMQMVQMGLFPELFTDPYQLKTFYEEFGMSDMYKDSNIDVKMAEKAIEMMLSGQYPPVLPEVHNPDIQLPVLLRFMKDPKYLETDPRVQVLFEKRRQELVAALVAAGPVAPPVESQNPQPAQGGAAGGGNGGNKDPFGEKL